jgi:hypothetical protein
MGATPYSENLLAPNVAPTCPQMSIDSRVSSWIAIEAKVIILYDL